MGLEHRPGWPRHTQHSVISPLACEHPLIAMTPPSGAFGTTQIADISGLISSSKRKEHLISYSINESKRL